MSEILCGIEHGEKNFCDVDILGIHNDSRCVETGFLFVCFKGVVDGHDFVREAEKKGAAAFVCERELETDKPQIIVKNAREVLGRLLGNFYDNPIRKMKLVTITGTNGKTTTSYILRSILTEAGVKCGLIGTTAYYVGYEKYPASLTTPDPCQLHKLFWQMSEAGCKAVVMELSAHAIKLDKLSGVVSDITVLTNITQDHLDFFHDFETYRDTKTGYFTPFNTRLGIVNADDPAGEELYKKQYIPTASYGIDGVCDAFALDTKNTIDGVEYLFNVFDDLLDIKFRLPGRHNIYNSMSAALAARYLGVDNATIQKGIEALKCVEGRFEIIGTKKGVSFVVDYAHTPDGVQNVLTALNELKTARLITVFGCGGDRDKLKRPLMGQAAAKLSDFVLVTSDNPRTEAPNDIIANIICGIEDDTKYIVEADRRAAIKKAYELSEPGDIVAVLGKGAEDYQDIGGVRYPFLDRREIENL